MTEPRTTTSSPPASGARGRWRAFRTGPHFPALVVTLILAAVAALFVSSYSVAMGNPRPHHVPIGVVGTRATSSEFVAQLSHETGTSFRVTPYPDRSAALAGIDDQDIYAAFVIGADGDRLYVSSASGTSVARVLEVAAPRLARTYGITMDVTDRHPMPAGDPQGLVVFYMALAAVIIGFVGAIQLRVHAPDLSLRARVGWDVAYAVLASLTITLAVGPVLRVLPVPVFRVWPILAVTMFGAGMVFAALQLLIGRWALLPTWLLFVLIGNPSSGGAVAPQLLPPFYELLGRWLPTGATVQALRSTIYFHGHAHLEPFVVLGTWTVVATTVFLAVRVRRDRASR